MKCTLKFNLCIFVTNITLIIRLQILRANKMFMNNEEEIFPGFDHLLCATLLLITLLYYNKLT